MNLSTDYNVFNEGDTTTQLEDATYFRRTSTSGSGSYTAFAIHDLVKLDTKTVEAFGTYGVYVKSYVDFELKTSDETSYSPVIGDYIIDIENIAYIVISVRRPVFGDYWGISTVCPMIVGGVSLIPMTAVEATDEYGDRKITFTAIEGNINGWIQPQTQKVQDMFGKRGFIEDYSIWLIRNVDINYGDLILAPDGTMYEIYEVNDKQKLDELMLLKGVIKP